VAGAVMVVISNFPDEATAQTAAAALIEARAAACVNILAPCVSVYRWRGALEQAREHPVLVKTTAERYEEVERILRHCHPYELPEIVAVPAQRGLPGYLDWVREETSPRS
jgi:periplasmic divalent cation tolerance protein